MNENEIDNYGLPPCLCGFVRKFSEIPTTGDGKHYMQPESVVDQPVAPDAGTPISFRPLGALADPGLRQLVYWLARCVFKLAAQPSVASLAPSQLTGHYEVFLNQTRGGNLPHYFSGDRYLWLQRRMLASDLTGRRAANDNIIEVLVRSDPRAHKNHIPFHPMLWCHLHLETPAERLMWRPALIGKSPLLPGGEPCAPTN